MIVLANKDKINCIFGILLGKGNVEKRCRKFPELLEIARKGSLNEEDIIKIAGILEKIGLRGVNARELVTKLLDEFRKQERKRRFRRSRNSVDGYDWGSSETRGVKTDK